MIYNYKFWKFCINSIHYKLIYIFVSLNPQTISIYINNWYWMTFNLIIYYELHSEYQHNKVELLKCLAPNIVNAIYIITLLSHASPHTYTQTDRYTTPCITNTLISSYQHTHKHSYIYTYTHLHSGKHTHLHSPTHTLAHTYTHTHIHETEI